MTRRMILQQQQKKHVVSPPNADGDNKNNSEEEFQSAVIQHVQQLFRALLLSYQASRSHDDFIAWHLLVENTPREKEPFEILKCCFRLGWIDATLLRAIFRPLSMQAHLVEMFQQPLFERHQVELVMMTTFLMRALRTCPISNDDEMDEKEKQQQMDLRVNLIKELYIEGRARLHSRTMTAELALAFLQCMTSLMQSACPCVVLPSLTSSTTTTTTPPAKPTTDTAMPTFNREASVAMHANDMVGNVDASPLPSTSSSSSMTMTTTAVLLCEEHKARCDFPNVSTIAVPGVSHTILLVQWALDVYWWTEDPELRHRQSDDMDLYLAKKQRSTAWNYVYQIIHSCIRHGHHQTSDQLMQNVFDAHFGYEWLVQCEHPFRSLGDGALECVHPIHMKQIRRHAIAYAPPNVCHAQGWELLRILFLQTKTTDAIAHVLDMSVMQCMMRSLNERIMTSVPDSTLHAAVSCFEIMLNPIYFSDLDWIRQDHKYIGKFIAWNAKNPSFDASVQTRFRNLFQFCKKNE